MSQDFSVLLHTPTDGTDGDCTASLKNPRGIEPRRILPQPRGSQAHTCMSPQSSDCLTFIHNLKPSDPSIFFRTPQISPASSSSLTTDSTLSAIHIFLNSTLSTLSIDAIIGMCTSLSGRKPRSYLLYMGTSTERTSAISFCASPDSSRRCLK